MDESKKSANGATHLRIEWNGDAVAHHAPNAALHVAF